MARLSSTTAGPVVALVILGAAALRADEEPPSLRLYRDGVDQAVDRALTWLAAEQRADGSYSSGSYQATNAVVGLVGMAFLAAGHSPGRPPYGDVLNRCTDYLLRHARADGYLGTDKGHMYEHGISTLFLSEVAGMLDHGREERVAPLVARALRLILDSQAANGMGAWRYELDSRDADISVTGWCLMALRSGRLNGAPVPKASIDRVIAFVDACRSRPLRLMDNAHSSDDGGYFYHPPSYYSRRNYWIGGPSTASRTGVALLSRELAGYHGDAINKRAGDYLLQQIRGPGNFLPPSYLEYATYYVAQGMFQLGGRYWEEFGAAMYRYLLPRQSPDGFWVTSDGTAELPYATAMYMLALTVSYRQLPIYQR